MKVRLLVSRAGPQGVSNRGDVIDVAEDEGLRMLAAEQCVLVDAEPERATKKSTAEKATKK